MSVNHQTVTEYLTERQFADEVGLQPQTLSKWRCEGRGPAFVKLGRAIRYRRADVERYIDSQLRNTSTATR